eukprot:1005761-Pyramimonas_sp.AAC.1
MDGAMLDLRMGERFCLICALWRAVGAEALLCRRNSAEISVFDMLLTDVRGLRLVKLQCTLLL